MIQFHVRLRLVRVAKQNIRAKVRRKVPMKTFWKFLVAVVTIGVSAISYATLTRGWDETFVSSKGFHGYVLASLGCVAIGGIVWLLPQKFLCSKVGTVIASLLGGGTIGGLAVGFMVISLNNPTPLQICCGLLATIASAEEIRLSSKLLRSNL